MIISAGQLPSWLSVSAWLLLVYVFFQALQDARWAWFKGSRPLNLLLGSSVLLMVLWTLRAGVNPGLSFHFLGATVLTLMFGWGLALVSFTLVLLGTTINLGGDLTTLAANLLVKGFVPIVVSSGVLWLVNHRLPHNVFVYIFVAGFFGAALAVLAQGGAVALVLVMAGAYPTEFVFSEYLAFTPLMMFSEAWVTGMLTAVFVSYRPQWLVTYSDAQYLYGQGGDQGHRSTGPSPPPE